MTNRRLDLSTIKVKPKYLAQKCPVCNGWGTVSFQRATCLSGNKGTK